MRKFIYHHLFEQIFYISVLIRFIFVRPYQHPPLFNMEFVIVGKFKFPTQEMERKLRKMGAKVVEDVHEKLTAVISNHDGVASMRFEMRQAKKFKIQVITDDFLTEDFKTIDPYQYIMNNDIATWGADVCKLSIRMNGFVLIVCLFPFSHAPVANRAIWFLIEIMLFIQTHCPRRSRTS